MLSSSPWWRSLRCPLPSVHPHVRQLPDNGGPMAYSLESRARAVARVLAGESRRAVAADTGIAASTIRAWLATTQSPETAGDVRLADRAQAIAGDIEHHETIARDRLIQRIVELAPTSEDLVAVTNAYAKLSDRALLRAGKPTSITGTVDGMDAEIERMLSEMAERETAASGDGDRAD